MTKFVTPTSFIQNIPIAIYNKPLPEKFAFTQSEKLPDIDEAIDRGEGFVNAGSVIAFSHNLEEAPKRDVLESTLFAQLAANAAADRLIDPQGWYNQYQVVLGSLGWSIGSFTLIKQDFHKSRIEIAEAAIEILSSALGGLSLKLLEYALESIRDMKKSNGIIQLLDSSSMADNVANFQLGQATADDKGNIDMPMGFFFFKSDSTKKKFMFIRWNQKRISLFADAQIISLNKYHYKAHRQTVQKRLATITAAMTREIPLAYR